MSGPYHLRDLFTAHPGAEIDICHDPENCTKDHNPEDPDTGEYHHYGCECGNCMYFYWQLKH